ncbi:N-acetylmuramoyl-L-alanine amidase [Maioricimonas rarisocia]|uniref:N-acetylmuramoyl-L-alanine amidase n=1 Tax=Maioricimonas rarisocia TaxID=2528026 RepID=A0A517ZE43_9PLAN|nr:N-acetylmuramoyl-L-alanine amidase [Maioricimonas rarisocia]
MKPSSERSELSAVPSWDELRQICRTDGGSRSWKYVVLHHTASSRGSVESIHRAHLQRRDAAGRPWRGIGYHFVIGNGQGMPDGAIESTFRWEEQASGAHAGIGMYNQVGIGICLVGNFETTPPTAAQLKSVRRLVALLKKRYDIGSREVIRHQDVKATACPGRMFPFREVATAAVPASFELASN